MIKLIDDRIKFYEGISGILRSLDGVSLKDYEICGWNENERQPNCFCLNHDYIIEIEKRRRGLVGLFRVRPVIKLRGIAEELSHWLNCKFDVQQNQISYEQVHRSYEPFEINGRGYNLLHERIQIRTEDVRPAFRPGFGKHEDLPLDLLELWNSINQLAPTYEDYQSMVALCNLSGHPV